MSVAANSGSVVTVIGPSSAVATLAAGNCTAQIDQNEHQEVPRGAAHQPLTCPIGRGFRNLPNAPRPPRPGGSQWLQETVRPFRLRRTSDRRRRRAGSFPPDSTMLTEPPTNMSW